MNTRIPKNPFACKYVYKQNQWLDPSKCFKRDSCDFCHTKQEFDEHPINKVCSKLFFKNI